MGQGGLGPPLYRTGRQVSSCWGGRGQRGQTAPGPWATWSPGRASRQPVNGSAVARVTSEAGRTPSWGKSQAGPGAVRRKEGRDLRPGGWGTRAVLGSAGGPEQEAPSQAPGAGAEAGAACRSAGCSCTCVNNVPVIGPRCPVTSPAGLSDLQPAPSLQDRPLVRLRPSQGDPQSSPQQDRP